MLRQGALAAIISDAPGQLRPERRDLLAHLRALADAGAGGVVLPMRFGGTSPDDDMGTAVLAERAEHFLERLRALDGTAEYNIMEHPHLEWRVNGPLPPDSFVDAPTSQQAEGGTAEAFGAAAAQPNG
ncbi:GvpL/GvpF family gas vesicle protein [Streptomyces sp. NPDC013187]|uniref:GvpL/GvpF family gas vesicle protein n=1 Tax=Streptomyces sp. NPDC013187 TaxID=3364865 RepID=UPI003698C388